MPHLDRPDLCVFDLDPPRDDPSALRDAALVRPRSADELALPTFVKTSGSKGFHILVPSTAGGRLRDVGGSPMASAPSWSSATRPVHAGVHQVRSRADASSSTRAATARRDVRRGLRRAREAGRAGVCALHLGGDRGRWRSPRAFTLETMTGAWRARRPLVGHGQRPRTRAPAAGPGPAADRRGLERGGRRVDAPPGFAEAAATLTMLSGGSWP